MLVKADFGDVKLVTETEFNASTVTKDVLRTVKSVSSHVKR